MTHAVRWLALARRTGVQSRNRNSRVRVSMLLERCTRTCLAQRSQSGPARQRCAGSWPRLRSRSVSEACPAVPQLIVRRAQPLAAAPPGASSLSSPRADRGLRSHPHCQRASRDERAYRVGAKKNPGQAARLPGFLPWRACRLFENRKPPGQCLEELRHGHRPLQASGAVTIRCMRIDRIAREPGHERA